MAQLFARPLKFLQSILKISLPFALLACLATPLYGWLIHWAPADEALSRYTNQTAIMVGGSYRSRLSGSASGPRTSVYRNRIYILFPSVFSEPKTVTISQQNDEPYQISGNRNGVFDMLLLYGLIVVGGWWFWLRKPTPPSGRKS